MKKMKVTKIIEIFFRKTILIKAIKISIFVGIILNLINQFDAISTLNYNKIDFIKLTLTFCVPFCVSMYTADPEGLPCNILSCIPTD